MPTFPRSKPLRASNNNNYDSQICRFLDRAEKCRTFEVATTIRSKELLGPSPQDLAQDDDVDSDYDIQDDEVEATDGFVPTTFLSRPPTNYFVISSCLRNKEPGTVPLPLRTFRVRATAIHLAYDPAIRRISVDEAAQKFGLLDLRAALADYLRRERAHHQPFVHSIGGQQNSSHTAALPFVDMQIWVKVWVQNLPLHDQDLTPAQTLFASPPNGEWTFGRYDTAIINVDVDGNWPLSGLTGK